VEHLLEVASPRERPLRNSVYSGSPRLAIGVFRSNAKSTMHTVKSNLRVTPTF